MTTLKKVRVENAVGMALAHDLTKIVPGKFKGVGFKRGHVIGEEDIDELLKIGKRNIYIMDLDENQLHEDVAALRIAPAVCGENLRWTEPKEGKSNIVCNIDGLLKVQVQALLSINLIGEIILSTIKDATPCRKEQIVAGTRIIPLMIAGDKIAALEEIARRHGPVLEVLPYQRQRVGLLVTGSEIYEGLVKDESLAYVGNKLKDYGCWIEKKIVATDDPDMISNALLALKEAGCELIVATGGLSVDPDDVTRMGVRKAGARIVSYGAPVLPGAMFLNAWLDDVPILGLPACVFFHQRTVYDIMLPRFLAGQAPTAMEIAALGHGGLCLRCNTCHFPACPYGR